MADDQPSTPQDPATEPATPPASPPAAAETPAAADTVAAAPEPEPPPDDPRAIADDIAAHMDQSTIDELLRQASFDDPATAMASRSASTAAAASASATMTPAGAASGAAAAVADPADLPPGAGAMDLPNFGQVMRDAQVSSIDLLRDVDLNVKIELGRSRMLVEDVLKLGEGSVVELDKLAGDPVDVFVNERLVARGEVLVLNDNFCVRINEIVSGVRDEGL